MENIQAKIRNRLSPIWNLVTMLLEFDNLPREKEMLVWRLMKTQAELIKENKDDLLTLIDSTMLADEYILCAAIWFKELPLKNEIPLRKRGFSPYNIDCGVVLCGWRHPNALYQMVGITGLAQHEAGKQVEGFLTNKNRFVDREEGMKIATAANQLVTDLHVSDELFSENLY